jgi:hypothetical protein
MTDRDPNEMFAIDLTDEERYLIDRGLHAWGGPARCTNAFAIGMGFAGVRDLFAQSHRTRERAEIESDRLNELAKEKQGNHYIVYMTRLKEGRLIAEIAAPSA